MSHFETFCFPQDVIACSVCSFVAVNFEFRIKEHPDTKLVSPTKTLQQPADVDTQAKCRGACLGPAGNGILPSGDVCYGVQFQMSTRICSLATSPIHRGSAIGWNLTVIVYTFFPVSSPVYTYVLILFNGNASSKTNR